MEKQRFILISDRVRHNAVSAVMRAPENFTVTVAPANRSNDQNAKFHAICDDIAKAGIEWAGKRRDRDEWKVLLVSGHTKATAGEVEFVPGLEGEFVNIRESTSRMSVARASSLIEYALAFCAGHDVPLHETMRGGYMREREAA
jgi:hypothetical protein